MSRGRGCRQLDIFNNAQNMRKLCFWYNRKHDRIGYLFQDCFKSEAVEDDIWYSSINKHILED